MFIAGTLLSASVQAAERLTLEDATRRVLQQHPQLQAAQSLEDAAAGRVQQAAIIANPDVSLLLEDFAGDTRRSIGAATTTWSLSQRFAVPGTRRARIAVAEAGQQQAALAIEATRLALIRRTRDAYVAVQVSEERLRNAAHSLELAQQLRDAVAARVEAGKVSPIELSRAGVTLAAAQRARRNAERQSETERAVQLADAGRLQDFTLSAGVKREAVTHDNSLQVGVSLPLPIFDRNQGERRATRADLAASEAELTAETQRLQQERLRLEAERESSFREVQQLHELMTSSGQAVVAMQEGYRAGKFSLIDLLDVQRAYVDAQDADLAAHQSFHRSDAALDELLGRDAYAALTSPSSLPATP
jgi:cobalt-zinc-cadmium efflux system outer membrane protein